MTTPEGSRSGKLPADDMKTAMVESVAVSSGVVISTDNTEILDTANAEALSSESMTITQFLPIGVGLWLAVFLVGLDQTIISNATPRITDEFKRLSDVGWYGSGYLLPNAAFQLFFGRIYANFSIKYTFLTVLVIFEIGSLICALAPTSTALIIGRAVAGLGASGIFSGVMVSIAYSAPVRIRPFIIASMGATVAVGFVVGPLLGGLFTSKLTWRWCFYINLPLGGITFLSVLSFFRSPERLDVDSVTFADKIKKIDLVSLLLFLPAISCLLLALQWGGTIYAWSDGRIIGLLAVFGLLLISFVCFEYFRGADASFPIRMLAKRNMAAATWNAFCYGGALHLLVYYIPFWHQIIRGVSAVDSGISFLPLILGDIIMTLLAGVFVSKFGYCNIMMVLGSIITPVGEGLLTTWTVHSGFSQWVSYQALTGIGIGLGQQQPTIAVQTFLPRAEVASGTAIIILMQIVSSAIFVSVGQSVLLNELTRNLASAFPNNEFDYLRLIKMGATEIRSAVPVDQWPKVMVAYNTALTKTYTVALCLSAFSMLGSLTMEGKGVHKALEAD